MRRNRSTANISIDGETGQMMQETGVESFAHGHSAAQAGGGWDDDENQLVTPRMLGLYRQLLAGQLTDKQFQTEIHYLKQRYFHSSGNTTDFSI